MLGLTQETQWKEKLIILLKLRRRGLTTKPYANILSHDC
jgi:hypothetical protein